MKHYDVVAAVVCRKGKYLCMQKGQTKYEYTSYKFEFPGGKVEVGETPQQALKRELLEEMNYRIEVLEELTKVEYVYPDFSISLQAFLCEALDPEFKMNEHVAFQWVEKGSLSTLDWAAADVGIVRALERKG